MLPSRLLYRPIGPGQLQAVLASGGRRFPPRRRNQAYFYPLEREAFARWIARHWHVPHSGVGYITRFRVEADYLQRWPRFCVGGDEHWEYRIPAPALEDFNAHIVGPIEVVAVCGAEGPAPVPEPAARAQMP
ncbi:MAG: hypothetical protein SV765_18990 [Pseudomonadota bacterium]|nr:hypothetical protein [Pseudomonadota bacterium]